MVISEADRDHLNRKIRDFTHAALMRKTLKLVCPGCKRERLLDCVPLWWMFERKGWDDRLPDAVKNFYCRTCWHGHCRVMRPSFEVVDTVPTGDQFDYPPEREWRRLVGRYRS